MIQGFSYITIYEYIVNLVKFTKNDPRLVLIFCSLDIVRLSL